VELILASIIAFASTNIDDIFLLMLFFGNKQLKAREIFIGQLLGIAVLIAISLIVSLIGLVVDNAYIGLLGFLPIYLGLKGIIRLFTEQPIKDEKEEDVPKNKSNHVFAVSAVTIANGGDNIGIYVPLFATLLWPQKLIMVGIFLLMTILWCILAKYFTKHPLIANAIDRYGHTVTPFILVLLGVYILYESKTISLIL